MVDIETANNLVQLDRIKHVELDRNYIKDKFDSGTIEVRSLDQLANIMTHGVSSGPFHTSLSKLGMCDIYAPNLRGRISGNELLFFPILLPSYSVYFLYSFP